jgi:hypothetical protein
MMTGPYTSAKTVIAWLGEEDSSTGLAFELLSALRASLLVQPDSLLLEVKEDEESFTRHKESSIEDEELLEGFKESECLTEMNRRDVKCKTKKTNSRMTSTQVDRAASGPSNKS